jgi:carboxymethylenebutenolidase
MALNSFFFVSRNRPLHSKIFLRMGSHPQFQATDGHSLGAYLARPENPSSAAIVVIQEIFGVNRHIRSVVDDYANNGLTALAPALFDRVQPGLELNYNSADAGRGREIATQIGLDRALLDVAAALSYASQISGIAKVGVVGFCFGGTLAWLAATRLHPAAAVAYYGAQIAKFAAEQPRCPIMLHFGAKDKHIPASEIQKIEQAHPGLPIFLYENAGHGFNCDQRPDFESHAAAVARQRTLAFFHSHLQTTAAQA